MAGISLPDRARALNRELLVPDENLDSTTVKNRLEASLSELTRLIRLALNRDLTAYHPFTLSCYLEGAIGGQLDEVKAMCKALWLATCQDPPNQPKGWHMDA